MHEEISPRCTCFTASLDERLNENDTSYRTWVLVTACSVPKNFRTLLEWKNMLGYQIIQPTGSLRFSKPSNSGDRGKDAAVASRIALKASDLVHAISDSQIPKTYVVRM